MKKKEAIFLIPLLFIFGFCFVSSSSEGYCLDVAVSNVSPSSPGIDEDFTLGILIDGCGGLVPEIITFELLDVSPSISVREPLKRDISLGYPDSDRFLIYHMKTSRETEPGVYHFRYRLNYGREGFILKKEDYIIITIVGDKAELDIASIKTNPVLPMEGETVELTLRVENAGVGTAKSVRVYVDHPFQGLKQSFIGALDSEEDGPAVFTFVVDKVGEYIFPITISYTDDFGDNEIKTDINISVLEKPSNIFGIVFAIIITAIIGGGIFYFFKVKKSKDKIIHQLLKGNNPKEKVKK